MDASRLGVLRRLLADSAWLPRTGEFGQQLRTSAVRGGEGVLLVGTPTDEPWHLAAHLRDDAERSHAPELIPTLVRHQVPPGAPAHLAVGLDRLAQARRRQTLLVVAPEAPPAPLLERLADARRRGVTLLSLDRGDTELEDLAHSALPVPWAPLEPSPTAAPELASREFALDVVQHLVSAAAGQDPSDVRSGRLERLVDGWLKPARRR